MQVHLTLLASLCLSGSTAQDNGFPGEPTAPEAVLPLGGPTDWDGSSIFGPRVLRHEGRFHLFYVGNLVRDAAAPARSMAIGYASSDDGVHWTKHGNGPVLVHPEHGRATSVAVLPSDGEWFAAFSVPGTRYNAQGEVFFASAEAPEGPWRVEEKAVLHSLQEDWNTQVMPLNLFQLKDGSYRLYYWGRNASIGTTGFGFAHSEDLSSWDWHDDPTTRDAPWAHSDPYLRPGVRDDWDGVAVTSASVLRTPTGWESYYVGYDRPISARGSELPPLWMGRATSPDGLTWKKDPGNPLFETSQTIWPLTGILLEDGQYVFYQDANGGLAPIRRFTAARLGGK